MGFAFFLNLNSNDLGCDIYCKAVYLVNKTHASLRKWICGTEKKYVRTARKERTNR